jgi:hypothetical protein
MKDPHANCPTCLILNTSKYPELYEVLRHFVPTEEDLECIAEQIMGEYLSEVS